MKKQWPGIQISDGDRELVQSIIKQDGILRGINQKDLLMIAASLAVKKNVPENSSIAEGKNDVAHPSLMNGDNYAEYRQYISLIYFLTAGNKELSNMSDTSIMVNNFVNYAHRGLIFLKTNYLESKDADQDITNDFVSLVSDVR